MAKLEQMPREEARGGEEPHGKEKSLFDFFNIFLISFLFFSSKNKAVCYRVAI